jgi:hypothetical protein
MFSEIVRRIKFWLSRDSGQADLEAEMRLHVELRAERLRASGMQPAEADAAARRRFGNQLQLNEKSREIWIGRLATFVSDGAACGEVPCLRLLRC